MTQLQNLLKNTDWQGKGKISKSGIRFSDGDSNTLEILKRLQSVCDQKGLGAPEVFSDESFPDINIVAEFIENRLNDDTLAREYEKICLNSDQLLAELGTCYKIAVGSKDIPVVIPRNCRHRLYYLDRQSFSKFDNQYLPQKENRQNSIDNPCSTDFSNNNQNDISNTAAFAKINDTQCAGKDRSHSSNPEREIFLASNLSGHLNPFSNNREPLKPNLSTPSTCFIAKKSQDDLEAPRKNFFFGRSKSSFMKEKSRHPILRFFFFLIMAIIALFVYQLPVGKNGSVLPGGNFIKYFFCKVPPIFEDFTVHITGSPDIIPQKRPVKSSVSNAVLSVPNTEARGQNSIKNSSKSNTENTPKNSPVEIAATFESGSPRSFVTDDIFVIPQKNNAVFSKENTQRQ